MGLSKKGRYVHCADCGCRLEINGVCKICGHKDEPRLAGMVPDIIGMPKMQAAELLCNAECQLILGNWTTEHNDTIATDLVISSNPVAGTQLKIDDSVDIIVSLGPAG